MAGRFRVEEIAPSFGAVITDLDIERINDDGWSTLYAAWLRYALLIFPRLNLSPEQQVDFAKRFGPVTRARFPISNIKADGSLFRLPEDRQLIDMQRGNCHWHTDNTYRPVQTKGTIYTAEIVPVAGGETGFADMRAAYDSLDEALKAEVETLTAHHSIRHGQQSRGYEILEGEGFTPDEWPGPLRPLVKTQPETGRKSLLIGRHAHSVSGMTAERSRTFLAELEGIACQPERIYFHAWSPGDTVLWDNRCLMHRGNSWDITGEPRLMWHTPIAGNTGSEGALSH